MPRRGQWSGFRFAIAHHAGHYEIRVVEHRSERVAERVTQLAAFMDGTRALRRGVAGNSAGKRELQKELAQSGLILADVRINLAVSALQVRVPDHRRAAVSGAGDVNHVEVVLLDDPVQVCVDEVLSGG